MNKHPLDDKDEGPPPKKTKESLTDSGISPQQSSLPPTEYKVANLQESTTTLASSSIGVDVTPPSSGNITAQSLEAQQPTSASTLLSLTHPDVVKLLKDGLKLQPKQLRTIEKGLEDDGDYPLNALSGSNLSHAIDIFSYMYDENKDNRKEALQEMVDNLLEDHKITNKGIAEAVAIWLLRTYQIGRSAPSSNNAKPKETLSALFEKFPQRQDSIKLVQQQIDIPFKTNERLITQLTTTFDSLLVCTDKQSTFLPFIACAPGTGKSRTLQEIYSLTKQGKEYKKNSIEILLTFGAGSALCEQEEANIMTLYARMVYSYLDFKMSFVEFFPAYWQNMAPSNLFEVLGLITSHWKKHRKSNEEHVYIYLAIDEFTKISNLLLEKIINDVGSFIVRSNSTKANIHLLPLFAGINYLTFTRNSAKSTFYSKYLSPYMFTTEDESSIIHHHLPKLRNSTVLWKVLIFLNKLPRLIEWFVVDLRGKQEYDTLFAIREAYKSAEQKYNTAYDHYPPEIHQKLLAYCITEREFSDMNALFADGKTFKELEDNGIIRIVPTVNSGKYTITTSLPTLKLSISSLTEQNTFQSFFDLLAEKAFKTSLYGRELEKFNALFEIVLNTCFLYLGDEEITLQTRFRGARFGNVSIAEKKIQLRSFPTLYEEKNYAFNSGSPVQQIPNNTIIQNKTQNSGFFDRFSQAKINGQLWTILWQDKGQDSAYRNISKKEIENIQNFHFLEDKLQKINANKDTCLPIIISTRPSNYKPSNGLVIIDRKGLELYYGTLIFKIVVLNIPIPFPIFHTEKYSRYELAIFLGIEDRKAERWMEQLCGKERMKSYQRIAEECKVDTKLVNLSFPDEEEPKQDNSTIINIERDGDCMFNSVLAGYFLIKKDTDEGLEVGKLRNMVADELSKEEYKDLLISQIRSVALSGEYEGFGELSLDVQKIKPDDSIETIEEIIPKYIQNIRKKGVWGGAVELGILAVLLHIDIRVVGSITTTIEGAHGEQNRTITLIFNGNHYYCVRTN